MPYRVNAPYTWSLSQNLRDRDEMKHCRYEIETKLEPAETKTRHETFGIKCLQNVTNFLTLNFRK